MTEDVEYEEVLKGYPETKEYRVRMGQTVFLDGYLLESGDVVHLTKLQANSFRDRFEPVDGSAPFKVHTHDVHQKTMDKLVSRLDKSIDPSRLRFLRNAITFKRKIVPESVPTK